MRLLFLGDIVGRSGREAVQARLPGLRRDLALDFVVANAENAAAGFGLTGQICADLHAAGVDVITTGNHVWDQREIIEHIARDHRVLRPLNFPAATPGRGASVYGLPDGRRVLVINAMGRLYMDPLDDPFAAVDQVLAQRRLGRDADFILVDLHAEATSEKMAMGHHCDGRVSMVVGTHTHVPTADQQVLPGGTAFMSDAGMCGDYDSVIGMKKEPATLRFVKKMPGDRLTPALGEATLCGVVVETDAASGLARSVEPLRAGGRLAPAMPVPAPLLERSAAE
ncbi:MAG: TIGR00282 family metallophosphoesterase [Alphaproteobacteria bacterium]